MTIKKQYQSYFVCLLVNTMQICINFPDAPHAPINLRVSNVTCTCLSLVWDIQEADTNSKATQFYIEMKDEKHFDFVPIARVDGSTNIFSTELLQKNRNYNFRVKGKNSAGYGESTELSHSIQLSKALGKRHIL